MNGGPSRLAWTVPAGHEEYTGRAGRARRNCSEVGQVPITVGRRSVG